MYRQAVLSRRASPPPQEGLSQHTKRTRFVRQDRKDTATRRHTTNRFKNVRPKPKEKKPYVWTPNLDYFAKRVYRELGARSVDILFDEYKKYIEHVVEENKGSMPPDQHLYLALFCRAASFQYIDVMRELNEKLKHRVGQKKQYDTWKAFTPFHTVLYPDPEVGYNIDRMIEAIDIIRECPAEFSPLTKNARGENAVDALWVNKDLGEADAIRIYMKIVEMSPSVAKNTFISLANKVTDNPPEDIRITTLHCLLSAPEEILKATAMHSLVLKPNLSPSEPNMDARNMISLLVSVMDEPPSDKLLDSFFESRTVMRNSLRRTWAKTIFDHLVVIEKESDEDVDKNAVAILLGQLAQHESVQHNAIVLMEEIVERGTTVSVSQVVRFLTQSNLKPPNLIRVLTTTAERIGSRAKFMVQDWVEGRQVQVKEVKNYGEIAYNLVSARKTTSNTDEEVKEFVDGYKQAFEDISFGEIAYNIVFGICELFSPEARSTTIRGLKQLMDEKKIVGVESALDEIDPDDLALDCPEAVSILKEIRKQLGLRFQFRASAPEFVPPSSS